MLVGAIGDNVYNVVLLAHILSVIVGAGAAFISPVLSVQARRSGGRSLSDFIQEAASRIVFPSLLISGVAGGALVGFSDDVFDFSQTWLSIAGALWIVSLVVAAMVWPPRYLNVFNLPEERRRPLTGVLHVLLIVMLVVMIWKPGL